MRYGCIIPAGQYDGFACERNVSGQRQCEHGRAGGRGRTGQPVPTSERDIVIVSDYIYSDAILYDELTDAYRRLAYIDRTLAAVCDVVLEVAFGSITLHKGGEVFSALYEKVL